MFCEQLDYNILFRWFLDMNFEEPSFDATSFTKNRERLLAHAVSLKFFDAGWRDVRTKRTEVEPTPKHGSCVKGLGKKPGYRF